jgi:basic membrane protein A
MIQAAKKFPNVQFCLATGTKPTPESWPTNHNAFANIYMGRYLAGVAGA